MNTLNLPYFKKYVDLMSLTDNDTKKTFKEKQEFYTNHINSFKFVENGGFLNATTSFDYAIFTYNDYVNVYLVNIKSSQKCSKALAKMIFKLEHDLNNEYFAYSINIFCKTKSKKTIKDLSYADFRVIDTKKLILHKVSIPLHSAYDEPMFDYMYCPDCNAKTETIFNGLLADWDGEKINEYFSYTCLTCDNEIQEKI